MAEPMPKPLFDALTATARLPLTPEEAERIRAMTRHLAAYAATVRGPDPLTTDPAITFHATGPAR